MCGIAGIVGVSRAGLTIGQMLDRIRHRGPDGCFTRSVGDMALAHARLSIIDLTDQANQPMEDPASGNIIIFNGEIYNYIELKKEIGSRYTFHTMSDTEVILAAYRVYGIDFLKRLRGMFALAIYDAETGRLLLARDRIGIKPLYYRIHKEAFYFASEIKSLLNPGQFKESVKETKAYEFLANCQLDTNEETMFSGVLQLLPGHYAWVDQAGNMGKPAAYWDFPEPGKRQFDNRARTEFLDVFEETIRIHLRSDVPVGAFLSGGIDSSSVSCFALRNMAQDKLHTFSAVLPYFHPENALIDKVIETSPRFEPHTFLLDGNQFFDDVRSVIYHHDEPVMDGSMYAHYKLCALAKDKGIKVLLSGSGGDELLGGYASHIHAHHARLLAQGKLGRYYKDMKVVSEHSAIPFRSLLIKSMYENLPLTVRRNIKNRQVKNRIRHVASQPHVMHYYHSHQDPYHANMVNNYKSWTAPPFLHYEDRNSMAHGVEVRVPFFDHELIEFILQFDPAGLIDGRTKSAARDSFRGIVPDVVLDQKGKYGFPSPIDHALRLNQTGKEIFFDSIRSTPLLNAPETQKLGKLFYESNGDVSIFWRTLSYMIWYQLYFNQSNLTAA